MHGVVGWRSWLMETGLFWTAPSRCAFFHSLTLAATDGRGRPEIREVPQTVKFGRRFSRNAFTPSR